MGVVVIDRIVFVDVVLIEKWIGILNGLSITPIGWNQADQLLIGLHPSY